MPSTLSAELTHALKALWTLYAGVSPTDAHTQIDGNTVTCVLVDGVSDFNRFTDMALGSITPTVILHTREVGGSNHPRPSSGPA